MRVKSAVGHWLAAAACVFALPLAADANYRLTTVAEGLSFPWCLAFLPNGDMLVTERSGDLHIIRDGVLDPQPIAGVPPVFVRSQGGLFDVLPHPDFAANSLLYLSYAHREDGRSAGEREGASPPKKNNATRIARARFDGTALHDVTPIFTVAPLKRPPMHYGGRMLFLADGTLLLTSGDGFVHREEAQRLDNLFGKVVRLRDDGSVPPDNPFVDVADARPEIWTYGHRNPQGIVVARSAAGDPVVYLHEHGPRGGDELNRLRPGVNYGWPVATFGIDYNGAVISPFTEYAGMEQPLLHWTPSIAPAGMAWYDGDLFPAWRGDLFVTSLVFNYIERIDLEGGEVAGQQRLFEEIDERLRDIRSGPDGHLYILTDSRRGSVIRVDPASPGEPDNPD